MTPNPRPDGLKGVPGVKPGNKPLGAQTPGVEPVKDTPLNPDVPGVEEVESV